MPEADLKSIGEVPSSVSAQAKKKSPPYKNAAEAIAEKFHTDPAFLAALNPGKTKAIKAGNTLSVPNVEPFEPPQMNDMQPGNETPVQAANDLDEEATAKKAIGNAISKAQSSETPISKKRGPAKRRIRCGLRVENRGCSATVPNENPAPHFPRTCLHRLRRHHR